MQDFSEGGYLPCLVLDNLQYNNSYVQDDNNKRIIIDSTSTV